MNCQECLAVLETGSLRELMPDSPVYAHASTCVDCARVTTLLRDREYEAATMFNNLRPASHPATIAESAIALSRRRRLGKIITMLTGTALAATIWLAAQFTFIPMMNRADAINAQTLHTETIALHCLSPEQASDIINPYVRSHGSAYFVPSSGLGAITVRGTLGEISKSREIISEFEDDASAACRASGTGFNGNGAATTAPVLVGDKAPSEPKKP
jgi:hypothetical protein